MELSSQELNDNLVFIDKPAGNSTSSLGPNLFLIHRLGDLISGCLIFGKTTETALAAGRAFRSRRVKIKYLFVTDRTSTVDRASLGSYFQFQRVKRSPFFELWEVTSSVGRDKQIQIHAAKLNLPILGDVSHGGTKFPHLCLHALELEIPSGAKWASPEPIFMKRLGFLKDRPLIEALSEMDSHQRQFDFLAKTSTGNEKSLRIMTSAEIQVDLLGDEMKVSWLKTSPLTLQEQERWHFISQLLRKNLQIHQTKR